MPPPPWPASPPVAAAAAQEDGRTPVYAAAYGGHEGTLGLLLAAGADPSTAEVRGCAPLPCVS